MLNMDNFNSPLFESTENDATVNQGSVIIIRDEDVNNVRYLLSEGKEKESNVNKESTSPSTVFNWREQSTKLLLNLYENNLENFNSPNLKKKTVWQLIANSMKSHNYQVSYVQCENKFKGLYATYKKIKDNNDTSGRARKTFQFMEEMERLFSKDPTIQPISSATSTSGFKVLQNTETPITSNSAPPITSNSAPPTTFNSAPPSPAETPRSTKRKIDEEPEWFKRFRIDSENRHKERMEAQNKFINLFVKMIEKM